MFEESERTRIGQNNCGLGTDLLVGGSVFSVQDKFRVRLFVATMAEYITYLPSGGRCEPLADLVFFYIGEQLEWEVELAIPAGAIQPTRLSQFLSPLPILNASPGRNSCFYLRSCGLSVQSPTAAADFLSRC